MKYNLLIILFTSLLLGCRSTNIVTINVTMPAPVSLPAPIKTIGTINRSRPSEETQKMDKIDQILSLEGLTLDKDGAQNSLTGLTGELRKNERFTEVKFLENVDLKSAGLGIFSAPLSWEILEKIGKEHNVDGIFSLEFFDTDSKVNYTAVPVTIKGPLGVSLPAIEHNASIITLIKTGWRIYDIRNKKIIDEFLITEDVVTTGKGINPLAAVSAVIGRKGAVLGRSHGIGQSYALSILPYSTRVHRDYYVRGSTNFKIAKRKAQTGNWSGAAELWNKETTNPKNKIAGRAYYNMAISSEINGDLDAALQWAQKSYENYNNRLALRYVKILEYRKQQNAQLKRQQEKKD